MIAAVAIVGAQNNPLYVRTFPNSEGDEALKVHYMVHCSLDTIEEKLLVKRPTEPTDLYLGLLYPTEENKLYGYISNANVKFIAAVNDKGSVMKEDAVGKVLRQLHGLYVDAFSNPFFTLPINSPRFDAKVHQLINP